MSVSQRCVTFHELAVVFWGIVLNLRLFAGGVKISVRRFGALDDLIGAALYLCSDASASMTGVCLPVDGGTLATL